MVVMEIKLWVLLGLVGFFAPLFMWAVRWSINRVVTRLDKLIEQNSELKNELTRQDGRVVNLKEKVEDHDKCLEKHNEKLDDHDRRIYHLEKRKK
jgi:predicted nuclease with TOPRIM domain